MGARSPKQPSAQLAVATHRDFMADAGRGEDEPFYGSCSC
jgi:hypothetical protein